MKKYIFWLFIVWLWLINFSIALDYLFIEDNWIYVPNVFVLTETHTFSSSDFSNYNNDYCWVAFTIESTDTSSWLSTDCEFFNYGDWFETSSSSEDCTFSSWLVYISHSDANSCDFTLSVGSWSNSNECEDCPVCENTYSTLFVAWTQITWSNNVYISIPDHFVYSPSYYTGYMDLVIENEGDPEYIENLLSIQTYRPTDDEFAVSFVGGLTLILPYVLIVLFVIFIVKIIRKIFK